MLMVEEIIAYEQHLQKMAKVIDDLNNPVFHTDSVAEWLLQAQQLAECYNSTIMADLALIKGKLLTYYPTKYELEQTTKGNRRQLQRRYAIACLEDAKSCIDTYMGKSKTLQEECSILCYKLAAVAVQKYSDEKERILEKIQQDVELVPAWVNAVGTVGRHNAVILFTEALKMVQD